MIMRGTIGKEESENSNDYRNLRGLIQRQRCLAPRTLNGDGDDDQDTVVVQGLSYRKLPPQRLIKLSVLKLDGSLFDVHVAKNGTVAELKQAIEEVFTASPKEGQGKISWSHVWGHFCLCYQGQKLINDKTCIRNFEIKDGDQLHFIRHMSINYSPLKRRSKKENVACNQYTEPSTGSNVIKENAPDDGDGKDDSHKDSSIYCHYEDQDEVPGTEFKLANFLRGWLSYSRLWSVSRRGSGGRSRPSRFSLQCLGGGPRTIQL